MVELKVGEQGSICVISEPDPAMIGYIVYESGDESVAIVEGSGVITAVGAGETKISVVSTTFNDDWTSSTSCETEVTVKVTAKDTQPDVKPDSGTDTNKGEKADTNSGSNVTLKATKIKSVKKLKRGFKVKWAKRSDVSGYQVRWSLKKNMKGAHKKTIKSAKKRTFKKTGLKRGRRYYVQVRTFKTVNGKRCYSAWSKAKRAK